MESQNEMQNQEEEEKDEFFVDNVLKSELKEIKNKVVNKDRDFVLALDGEEGCGKSVLAMQIGKFLDPSLDLTNITFSSDQFIERLKNTAKNSCVILDEAYNAASSRGALTEVNRSLIGVATEMRQKNLFVIIVLPTFFDLDKYFAIWRCKALIHTYFDKKGDRGRYVIFPKGKKKFLYLTGKKFYDYSKVKSPFPACRFNEYYPVDEDEYRKKKAEAFKERTVSNQAQRWRDQRNSMIRQVYHEGGLKNGEIRKALEKWGAITMSQREINRIVQLNEQEDEQ